MADKRLQIPEKGIDGATLLEELKKMKAGDTPWRSGRIFGYTYEASEDIEQWTYKAYMTFLGENGLDPTMFPSARDLETQVISMAADLLGGDEHVTGNFTSGGTESIMLAVKTARDYFRDKKPEIKEPELVIPRTGHAAFHKAGHYLGVKVKVVPVNPETYEVEPEAMEAAITENTIMLVVSTPSYPHGVVDPVEPIAKMAKERGLLCHVDACVGGMYLPFAEELGYDVPPFDFRVEGVTSMSCDFHKYGYAAKGASCVLHRNADLRRYQIFTCASWSGYSIVNPTVLSSKTLGPLAGAWMTLRAIGKDGYKELVDAGQKATQEVIEGIAKIPDLYVMGNPVMNLVAVASNNPDVNIFELADVMKEKYDWGLQVQLASEESPEAIHYSVNRSNVPHVAAMLKDLATCVEELKAKAAESEESMQMDPAVIQGMLANFTPEMFDQLEGMLGVGGDNPMPDQMAFINGILNHLSSEQRDMLLTEFVNRLFTIRQQQEA